MRRGYIKIPKCYRRNLDNYIGFGLGSGQKMTVEESLGVSKKDKPNINDLIDKIQSTLSLWLIEEERSK